ncbi:hypothetical protein BJX76DRAFT_343415 [Aspergillus varians]
MGEENKAAGLRVQPDDPDTRPSPATESPVSATGVPTAPNPSQTGQQLQPQSQSQSKSFEFVLVTDNESRRQVRRHAMRQYMQQRRLDSITRLGVTRVPAGGWTNRPTMVSDSSHQQPIEAWIHDAQNGNGVPAEKENISPSAVEDWSTRERNESSRRVVPKSQKVKREPTSLSPAPKLQYAELQTLPSQGTVRDPFSSYPIPVTGVDHELIQHFVVTYPYMMYKFLDSAANKSNPMKEIFSQLALHDELPFQAMLAIAAKHRAGVDGKTESVQSLTHKMRALRLMNERIQTESKSASDGTIYAVATMAVIEKWSKDESIERMHFRGLASMIKNRGGMQVMHSSSPFLEKVLYWVDFSCALRAIIGSALPWTGALLDTPPTGFDFINPEIHLPIPHSPSTHEDTEVLCDQFRACEDFLRFFRHLHELERTALNSPSPLTSTNTPPYHRSFTPGTRLYFILTRLPDYDHGIRDIRFIDEYTCMSCLFFLAVALYHSYSSSTPFNLYLKWLDREIHSMNPHENPSITSMLWLFLENSGFMTGEDHDQSGSRCWVVSRMVRITKHLEWKRHGKIWDTIRQTLINFVLTQQKYALGEEVVDAEALAARASLRDATLCGERPYFWDEDELRREILGVRIPACNELGLDSFVGVGDLNIPVLT